MGDALTVFKTINNESDKQVILQKLLSSQESLILRDKQDHTMTLKALSLNSNMQLKCRVVDQSETFPIVEGVVLTATFIVSGEKYIFKTKPSEKDGYITLNILYLFHLQKRSNFRYSLPRDYPAKLIIKGLNHAPSSYSCRMLDLSTEGCAVEISLAETNLNLSDVVDGEIFLGDRAPISIQGFIKNIREKDELHLIVGISFNHTAHNTEDKILNTISELRREFFNRRAA